MNRRDAPCTVVNLRKEAFDVYIGRPGKGYDGYFGNPFTIGADGDRSAVLAKYSAWFAKRVETDVVFRERVLALRGKRLGCFCKPAACHGDVIASFVNEWPYGKSEDQ